MGKMKKILISISLVMITTLLSNAYANFDSSRSYSPNEIELMTRSCDRGYLDDCNIIGFIFLLKNKDSSKSIEPFTKACDGGLVSSCAGLAMLYGDGIHIKRDTQKAKQLFTKACNSGHMGGCFLLGKLYSHLQEESKAIKPLVKACDDGVFTDACDLLGNIYYFKGELQDYSKALRFSNKACDDGVMISCARLGFIYGAGKGVEADEPRGTRLLKKACNGGHEPTCKIVEKIEKRMKP